MLHKQSISIHEHEQHNMKEITIFECLLGRFEKNTPGQGGLAVYRSTIPRSILVVTAK